MFWLNATIVRRTLVQIVTAAAIVALTVLAMRLLGPQAIQAQPAQQDEVRASAFVLVGPDGTVLGRLAPGPTGNGNLTLYDTAGRRRAWITGGGLVTVFDTDDKPAASLVAAFGATPTGLLVFDANTNARIALTFDPSTSAGGLGINDANRKPRIRMGSFDGENFGFGVLDAEGTITHTAYPVPRP